MDRIRSEELRRRLGVVSLETKIEQAMLRWLGRVQRMGEARIPKLTLKRTPDERRPQKRWKDSIHEIFNKI